MKDCRPGVWAAHPVAAAGCGSTSWAGRRSSSSPARNNAAMPTVPVGKPWSKPKLTAATASSATAALEAPARRLATATASIATTQAATPMPTT
jgi:hypothetical protein